MKIFIKIISTAFFILLFTTCRKEVKEPNSDVDKYNSIYVKIDNEEYLFEDKPLNIYSNTRAKIEQTITWFNEESITINLTFKYKNKLKDDKYSSEGNMKLYLSGKDKKTGITTPHIFIFNGLYFNNNKTIDSQIDYHRYDSPKLTNDSLINIQLINIPQKQIVFTYDGFVLNRKNSNILPIHIKIKLNLKDN